MIGRPRRTSSARARLVASGALLVAATGLGGCARDPLAPAQPGHAAVAAPRRDAGAAYPTGPVPFTSDGGTYWVDPVASTLTGPDGGFVLLAPDALDYFVGAWQHIQDADQAGAEVERESSARRAAQPRPTPPPACRVGLNGRCTPGGDPVSQPGRPLGAGWGLAGAGTQDAGGALHAVGFWDVADWNCRDIAIAMRDEMVQYRDAKKVYVAAIGALSTGVIKNGMDINPRPAPGTPYWPEPQTLGKLFWYYATVAAAGTLEIATANFEAARTRVGFLGTLYNAQDCLHKDWDPPVEQSSGGSGSGRGGSGGSPGGSSSVCYYEVKRDAEGVVWSTTLLYCSPL